MLKTDGVHQCLDIKSCNEHCQAKNPLTENTADTVVTQTRTLRGSHLYSEADFICYSLSKSCKNWT